MATNPDLTTVYEKSGGKKSATYDECIAYYKQLSAYSDKIKLLEYGTTDIGKPLHLVVVSKDKVFSAADIHKQNKRVLLINNGIHPGEPDGVDACMMLARDLVSKLEYDSLLNHVVIIIIPIYNISGSLNRGCCSRANQDGPEEYGFRGNVQNLDLNRDFIKCDSREAQTFTQIFTEWKPDMFVDTHVTDGADFQYVATYIATQHNKLNPLLADYQQKSLIPFLEKQMKQSGYEMSPYVNGFEETPDSGLVEFLETPRYSTGYTALFNCIGFILETHMLKPFDVRVISTYQFLLHTLVKTNTDYKEIGELRIKANKEIEQQQQFPLNWQLDKSQHTNLQFKGYTAKYKPSEITGQQRLYYDKQEPYEKPIKFFNTYTPQQIVQKPKAYIVPQHCEKIISLFKLNGVKMEQLKSDTIMDVQVYYINKYKTTDHAFEGHYLHSAIEVKAEMQKMQYYKGDYIIYTNQTTNRYIVEALEPQGGDSFFAWGFFDGILMQKEEYSPYVWEDKALELLQTDAELKQKFEAAKKADPDMSAKAQLDFIYHHSSYFEKSFQRYPVGRLMN